MRPSSAHPALDPERRRVLGDGEELLLHRERHLHRPPGEEREHRDQRLELDVELRAEAAAEERRAHPDAVLGPAEEARKLDPDEGRALRRGVDRERVLARLGHRHERLERRVHHLLGAERVLEDVVGGGERLPGVAAAQVVVERDVGVLAPLHVLQVGEGAGRLELVVHDRLRGHRLDLVVDRGQLLVLGDDEVRRLLGDVRIGREHDRDRLADVAHLVDREDRLVVERRAVVRLGDDGADVVGGDHAVHAADRLRGADVDALDATVRDGAAEDLAVEHPRQAQVVDVLRAPGDLLPRLEPRDRAADLRGFGGRARALHRDPVDSSAARTARRR